MTVLTRLGLNTGFAERDLCVNDIDRCGLEHSVYGPWPKIVKTPWICYHVQHITDTKPVSHVLVPIRDLSAAVASRRFVYDTAQKHTPGGLWANDESADQERMLLLGNYHLSFFCAKHSIPITYLHYPRLLMDVEYTYATLRGVGDLLANVPREYFVSVFANELKMDWVHCFSSEDKWQ